MRNDTCVCLDMIMTGQRLRDMIAKKGYSIKDIQKKLNLSCPQPVYRWLNGQNMPSLDNLYMLSSILDTPMEDLLMPRNDAMWLLHFPENTDGNRRMKLYYGAINKGEQCA